MTQGVAITGAGIVSSIGCNQAEVWQSIVQQRRGIGPMKYLSSTHREFPVGEVSMSNDEMKVALGIDASEEVSRTVLLGMLAVRESLADAGLLSSEPHLKSRRVVLISGTTVGGMDITEQHIADLSVGKGDADCIKTHDGGSTTQLIADHFGCFTACTTLSTACSSAANALMLGARLIAHGEADIVVAGGTEALSRFHFAGFHSLMILDQAPCKPFDAHRAGLNLGEGAAYVVLESAESVTQRHATVRACLTGYGNACDAFHQTASSDDGQGAYLAMQAALKMAGVAPEEVDYINAHGTGTPNNDASESQAIRRVFDAHLPLISSTKGFTGHTTSASGSIETVICLLAMQHELAPMNIGWHTEMPNGIVPLATNKACSLQQVLCNSFGFGGNDTSLLFSLPSKVQHIGEQSIANCRTICTKSRVNMADIADPSEIKRFVKPMELRRMSGLMRRAVLTSMLALEEAGIAVPDAIITATSLGCLENSEKMLLDMVQQGEDSVSPTLFMQSTHNTIGSTIAIKLGCHGYNATYTQGEKSLEWALKDAELLLQSGACRSVLVGYHDETTALYRQLLARLGEQEPAEYTAIAMVLTCGD